jgi:CTP synthase
VPTEKSQKPHTSKKTSSKFNPKNTKYIFVTGGVISGLGKGIATASLAKLIKGAGYDVSVLKADMYLNVDAGTMNPIEHGEVFVTADGKETDQDMGHYERFLNQDLHAHNYMTMGQIYYEVLMRERRLEYDGKSVEGHIHIPQEIIKKITDVAVKDEAEIVFVEVGGTVGEYQNILFFEAIRRFKQMYPNNVFLVHLVYLLTPPFLGEMKSKPAQASIYELYKLGLHPDFIVTRSHYEVDEKRRKTISFNTGIPYENIIAAPDVDTIYKIPVMFQEQNFAQKMLKHMGLKARKKNLEQWTKMVENAGNHKSKVKIAIAGKYFSSGNFSLEDAYVCVIEALKHAAWSIDTDVEIKWFAVERLEDPKELVKIKKEFLEYDGIIVPQGWGKRGVEGKIKAVEIARVNQIPYLGLCFGMQMAVIEYARNVLGLKDANSVEVNEKTKNPVIHIMPDQEKYLREKNYGGTIRVGDWPCAVKNGTILYKSYSTNEITERHRHRYEFNNEYREILERAGLVISGTSPDGKLVEAVELPRSLHPFFVGTQFHPEYKSRPLHPHPIFVEFLGSCQKA